jgi:anti-anti-sigma factor
MPAGYNEIMKYGLSAEEVGMKLLQYDKGEETIIALEGELSGVDGARLTARVDSLVLADAPAWERMVIDLTRVSFIESTALGSLIYCHKAVERIGKHFALRAKPEHAFILFRGCPLQKVLTVIDPVLSAGF